MSGAREVARQVVTRVREREAYAHETLDALLRPARLDERDTAFATRLAYGTIASRGTLDEALDRHISNPKGVEPSVRDALAVSAYEILFASTPARAAVSEGVELVRRVQPRAAGLANAVLRRLAEDAPRFPWGDPEKDNAALARLHGHPRWLAELWIAELGRDIAAAVMAADNEPAPLYLSALPFAATEEAALQELTAAGAEPQSCPLAGCMSVARPAAAIRSEAVKNRAVVVADAGAQFAVRAVRAHAGDVLVEIGAGRGGKSLMLAGAMLQDAANNREKVTGKLVAVDNHAFKLEGLKEAAQQFEIGWIETTAVDAADPAQADRMPGTGTVDAVLVDAPCSGLGTLRRHPDRRWRASYDDVETLGLLGEKLLAAAARLVKPGGFVVYSTCTIARRENTEVIDRFLSSQEGAGFTVDTLADEVPADWQRFVDGRGMFQSVPELGGMDGHFVARLKRG